MSNKIKQNILAALSVLLWGSAIPVTKMIGASISPFSLSAVKCLIAALLLIVIAVVRKAKRPRGFRQIVLLALASLCGFSLYMVTSTIGMMTTPASTASIITSLSPIMTAIGAVAFYRQRITRAGWLSIAAAFVGVVIIVMWNGQFVIARGILWLLLSTAFFSAYSLLVPLLSADFSADEIVTYAMLLAAVMLSPYLPGAVREMTAASPLTNLLLLYMGIFPGCLAYITWSQAFALAENSSDVANYMYLTPVMSTVAAYLLLGEIPDMGIYVGGILVIISVIVFNLKGEKKKTE